MAIASIIKYEGDNSTFVWKHPCEDFNTMTQLIVHESQEAIFFLNGQALDLFGPGRHTLETQNIPKVGGLLKRATGSKTPFHCEVYFINKAVQMSIKWGTDSKVRFLDPNYGFPIEIGACGEMNLAVLDSRKLLVKLVGTMNGIAWSESEAGFAQSLLRSFRPMISTAVKANLASAIKAKCINILEIDENLEILSEALRVRVAAGFEEYGLTVPQFFITNVMLPEDDPNFKKMKELHTVSLQNTMARADAAVRTTRADADAQIAAAKRRAILEEETTATEIARMEAERKMIRAQADAHAARAAGLAEADVMAAKGYTQRDVIHADVQKAYAEGIGDMTISGAGGGVAADMIGLGVGLAAAGAIAPKVSEMVSGATNPPATPAPAEEKCAACGAPLPANAKFCLECGEKVMPKDHVICPACGLTVRKGKFCPECGHKFITVCPSCGRDVPDGAKFCLECGTRL